MKKALFPGSFDPFTLGHLDILKRSCALFDTVVIAVVENPAKHSMFTAGERVEMIRACAEAEGLHNVEFGSFEGFTVEYARRVNAGYIVRGLRNGDDHKFESGLETYNRILAPEIETVYLNCDPALAHISSSAMKELMHYGADIGAFVPDQIYKYIVERLKSHG